MTDADMKPCTVCGSLKDNKFLFEKENDDRGVGSINICQCGTCQAVYLGRYNEFFDDELYAYYAKYTGKSKDQVYDSLTKKSYLQVLKLLEAYGCGKSILDVGCGNGSFVDAALEQGYNIKGIELSQAAVDIAQGFNLPVHKLDFFAGEIEDASLDVVTMFEVMEHLPQPVQFLQRAEQVVKPGGLIYLTTPNFQSLDRRVLGESWDVFHREHLTYFTRATLINAVANNTNLEVLHAEARNISGQLINYVRHLGSPVSSRARIQSSEEEETSSTQFDARTRIAQSPLLLSLKRGVNSLLDATSLGSTLVMLLRRPRAEALG